jgi:serine/threonine protein kinase
VFRCKNKTTGDEFAVKKIEKKKLSKEDDYALRNEVSIMSQLRHPNIVQLEVAYESTNCYFLVMELVTGGELFERLLDKRNYSEREARNLVRILLEALAFCHRKQVGSR